MSPMLAGKFFTSEPPRNPLDDFFLLSKVYHSFPDLKSISYIKAQFLFICFKIFNSALLVSRFLLFFNYFFLFGLGKL